jgi:hypothetical protein
MSTAPAKSSHKDPSKEEHIDDEFLQEFEEHHEVKTFLSWNAPGRPFRRRSKEYFVNCFLITIAIEIILFLFSQYLLMLVVFSLAFFAFALAIVPPHTFFYKISSEGVQVEDNFFIWDELYDFYFMKRQGVEALHIRTKAYFPGELTIVLGDIPVSHAKAVLLPFLPYREYVEPAFMDKAAEWLEKNFPLEKTHV